MRVLALTLVFVLTMAVSHADTVLRIPVNGPSNGGEHSEKPTKKSRPVATGTERAPFLGGAGSDSEMETICEEVNGHKVCRLVPKGTKKSSGLFISIGDLGAISKPEPKPTTPPVANPPTQPVTQVPLFAGAGPSTVAPSQPPVAQQPQQPSLLQKATQSGIRFSQQEIAILQRMQQDQANGVVNVIKMSDSPRCKPCRDFAPRFNSVASQFSTQQVRFDSFEFRQTPGLWQFFKVDGIPNITAIKNNNVLVEWKTGDRSSNQFQREVVELLQQQF